MSRTNTNAHTGLLIGIIIVVAIMMSMIFLLASYLNAGDRAEEEPVADTTSSIIVGGIAGPSEVDMAGGNDASVLLEPDKVVPGDTVQVMNKLGTTRLYSDADLNALVMDQLTDGEHLTVLEPSSEYDAYPVENDERQWIRVRAADGLVGWVDAGKLTE